MENNQNCSKTITNIILGELISSVNGNVYLHTCLSLRCFSMDNVMKLIFILLCRSRKALWNGI